ncbi:MAG TPA: cytochrome c, partial [Candidatus Manganitrophaceae bacterium]|nr:cytochrome c [Candidatus Manganitrophaceae bacterium]
EMMMRWRFLIGWTVFFLTAAQAGWAADGAQLYSQKCAACHGSKGEGGPTGPALKGDPFITHGKPADIKKVILQGRNGADKKYKNIPIGMPGGLSSEPEADALVKFLQGDLQK